MSREENLRIEVCEGVYEPAEDSQLMLSGVECRGRVLEIGPGTGIVSVHCAMEGSEVDAADINPAAVECTLRNAELNGVRVNAFVSDLFSGVPRGKKYDTIIFNPPYLPTDDRVPGSEQWDGGNDGFRVTRPFLSGALERLRDGGSIFIILSSLTDSALLMEEFPHVEFQRIAEDSFFFEKIFVYRITPKSSAENRK